MGEEKVSTVCTWLLSHNPDIKPLGDNLYGIFTTTERELEHTGTYLYSLLAII